MEDPNATDWSQDDHEQFVKLIDKHSGVLFGDDVEARNPAWVRLYEEAVSSGFTWTRHLSAVAEQCRSAWEHTKKAVLVPTASPSRFGMAAAYYDAVVQYKMTGQIPHFVEEKVAQLTKEKPIINWRRSCDQYSLHAEFGLMKGDRIVLKAGECEEVVKAVHELFGHIDYNSVTRIVAFYFYLDGMRSLAQDVVKSCRCQQLTTDRTFIAQNIAMSVNKGDYSATVTTDDNGCRKFLLSQHRFPSADIAAHNLKISKLMGDGTPVTAKSAGMSIEEYTAILEYKQCGRVPAGKQSSHWKSTCALYDVGDDGKTLWKGGVRVLLCHEVETVIRTLHEGFGHCAKNALEIFVAKYFFSKGVQKSIWDFVRECALCKMKDPHTNPPPSLDPRLDVSMKYGDGGIEKRQVLVECTGANKQAVRDYIQFLEQRVRDGYVKVDNARKGVGAAVEDPTPLDARQAALRNQVSRLRDMERAAIAKQLAATPKPQSKPIVSKLAPPQLEQERAIQAQRPAEQRQPQRNPNRSHVTEETFPLHDFIHGPSNPRPNPFSFLFHDRHSKDAKRNAAKEMEELRAAVIEKQHTGSTPELARQQGMINEREVVEEWKSEKEPLLDTGTPTALKGLLRARGAPSRGRIRFADRLNEFDDGDPDGCFQGLMDESERRRVKEETARYRSLLVLTPLEKVDREKRLLGVQRDLRVRRKAVLSHKRRAERTNQLFAIAARKAGGRRLSEDDCFSPDEDDNEENEEMKDEENASLQKEDSYDARVAEELGGEEEMVKKDSGQRWRYKDNSAAEFSDDEEEVREEPEQEMTSLTEDRRKEKEKKEDEKESGEIDKVEEREQAPSEESAAVDREMPPICHRDATEEKLDEKTDQLEEKVGERTDQLEEKKEQLHLVDDGEEGLEESSDDEDYLTDSEEEYEEEEEEPVREAEPAKKRFCGFVCSEVEPLDVLSETELSMYEQMPSKWQQTFLDRVKTKLSWTITGPSRHALKLQGRLVQVRYEMSEYRVAMAKLTAKRLQLTKLILQHQERTRLGLGPIPLYDQPFYISPDLIAACQPGDCIDLRPSPSSFRPSRVVGVSSDGVSLVDPNPKPLDPVADQTVHPQYNGYRMDTVEQPGAGDAVFPYMHHYPSATSETSEALDGSYEWQDSMVDSVMEACSTDYLVRMASALGGDVMGGSVGGASGPADETASDCDSHTHSLDNLCH